jgi:MFS family permease
LPVTALMVALSPLSGELAHRIGPRTQLTAGPLVIALSLVLMAGIEPGDSYLPTVALPITIFGLGLAATVSPVTSSALAALDSARSGLASGVNNSVARTSQLLAVASLPPMAGLTGDAFTDIPTFVDRFPVAMLIAAGVALLGGAAGFVGIRGNVLADD